MGLQARQENQGWNSDRVTVLEIHLRDLSASLVAAWSGSLHSAC